MAVSVQRGLGSSDREAAVGLASSNPFDTLRNYLHLGLDRSADAGDRFRSALDTEGASVLCAVDGGVLRGVAGGGPGGRGGARRRAWVGAGGGSAWA